MDGLPNLVLWCMLRTDTSRGVTVECGDVAIISPQLSAFANVIHDHTVHTVYYTVNNSARADSTRSLN